MELQASSIDIEPIEITSSEIRKMVANNENIAN